MSTIPGTVVGATIVPTDTADVYSTHNSTYGSGGWRTVADIAERNAIATLRRQVGMVVYVEDADGFGHPAQYQLVGGITNSDWQIHTAGVSGSGTATKLTSWASTTDLSSAPAYISSGNIYVDGPLTVTSGGTGLGKTTEIYGNMTGHTAFSGTTLAILNKGDAEMALYADSTKNCNILFCDNYSGSVPASISWSNPNAKLTITSALTAVTGRTLLGTTTFPGDTMPLQVYNSTGDFIDFATYRPTGDSYALLATGDASKSSALVFTTNLWGATPAWIKYFHYSNAKARRLEIATGGGEFDGTAAIMIGTRIYGVNTDVLTVTGTKSTLTSYMLDAEASPDTLTIKRYLCDPASDADKGPCLSFVGPSASAEGVLARIMSKAQSSTVCRLQVEVAPGPGVTAKNIVQFISATSGSHTPDATAALELLPGSTIQSEGYHWQSIWSGCTFTGFTSTTGTIRAYKLGRTALVQFDINGTSDSTVSRINLPDAYKSSSDGTSYGLCSVLDNSVTQAGSIAQYPSSSTLHINNTTSTLTYDGWTSSGTRWVKGQFIITCASS